MLLVLRRWQKVGLANNTAEGRWFSIIKDLFLFSIVGAAAHKCLEENTNNGFRCSSTHLYAASTCFNIKSSVALSNHLPFRKTPATVCVFFISVSGFPFNNTKSAFLPGNLGWL
jgi:hypothetical protein